MAVIVATVGISGTLHAQDGPASIRGIVRDSAGQPIEAVAVEIEATSQSILTTNAGTFRLRGLLPGPHLLKVTKSGFVPRFVRVAIDGAGTLNLGSIVLTPLSGDSRELLTVTGTITDVQTGSPVPSVSVGLNGTVVAVTDDNGTFRGVAGNVACNTNNRLTAQRIGYGPVNRVFQLPETVAELNFDITLEPTSVELAEITVEAEAATSARLNQAGFFRREKMSFGHFFDAEDIQKMQAQAVTDVLRRVPGATVWSAADAIGNPGSGNDGQVYVRFSQRIGTYFPGMQLQCKGNPLLFVDNAKVPIGMLDFVRDPERLAGMEVYQTNDQTPAEYAAYNPDGNCGTIVVWTKDAAGLTGGSSPFQIGGHLGTALADGTRLDRIGGQITIPFRGPLSLYLGFTQRVRGGTSSSHVFLAARFNPLGPRIPWYAGTGVALSKPQLQLEPGHVVVTGWTLPVNLGSLRPFTELQVTDPLSFDGAAVFGFLGVNLRIDTQ